MGARVGTAVDERWQALRGLRALPLTARLLALTQLFFNIGFYLVIPYLAGHLADHVGLVGWVVGLVLGLRTFSQQGLFAVGGALTDRFGAKPTIVIGCLVRASGFTVLAVAAHLPLIVLGVVLTGLAGALFSPAVESSLAQEVPAPARADAFAAFAVGGEIGAVTGPLLGIAVAGRFQIACAAGAVLFTLIALVHWGLLPGRPGAHRDEPLLDGWRQVFGNRRFLVFAAGCSAYWVSYNQLYLALPVELESNGAPASALGLLFALASAMIVVLQVPLTSVARRVLGRGRAVTSGFVVMAVAFFVVATVPGLVATMTFVVLLTFGQMLLVPFVQELVPVLAGERRLGVHFGLMASVGGAAVLVTGPVSGLLLEHGRIAWLCFGVVPLVGALVVGVLARGNVFGDRTR
ncbi:MFS transporter [Lentzea sp. JNUCC 0626]|uniref:MFS transporter n=1 Tax=Lentzea sp. JNUCC 0626 TaxID=3367513 RepID=UPI003747FF65